MGKLSKLNAILLVLSTLLHIVHNTQEIIINNPNQKSTKNLNKLTKQILQNPQKIMNKSTLNHSELAEKNKSKNGFTISPTIVKDLKEIKNFKNFLELSSDKTKKPKAKKGKSSKKGSKTKKKKRKRSKKRQKKKKKKKKKKK